MRVCVCVCVESRVCLLCLNTNSWETVGGMESVPCAAFRGSVVNIVSGTSLTVTHETDADTVADYPTFVWLDRPDRSYFSFLCLCGEWHQFFGPRMICGENVIFGANFAKKKKKISSLWLQEHLILYILCVGRFPTIFRQYTYILAAACVTLDVPYSWEIWKNVFSASSYITSLPSY